MEMITGTLRGGTRYLRVISEAPTNYENGTVTYTTNNEVEFVECAYKVSKKIKSEMHDGMYYDWYQLDGEERRADKTPAIMNRIADLEEFLIEDQYQITLLQLGIEEV